MCVPTSSRGLAGVDQQAGVEPALGLGQAVADLLEPPGQAGVVEGEPDVVLDDPQALAGAVGRGVEDPGQVDAAAGLGQVQRGDVRGHRDRPGLHGGDLRQAVAQRLELQAGGAEQLGDRTPRRPSARPAGARCRPRASDRAPRAWLIASPRTSRKVGRPGQRLGRPAPAPVRRSSASSSQARGPMASRSRPVETPNSASSSAARLSASSVSAASRSSGSTSAAPRRRATASARPRARSAPAV